MRKWIVVGLLIGSLVSGIYVALSLLLIVQRNVLANETAVSDIYLPLISKPHDTFYVSKLGNNGDGLSWATAWNELDQIDWSIIQPGHTILIDGGSTEMVYTTIFEPEASGTANKPINIRLANEAGRDGKAIIFGGRSTPLPYCDQGSYTFETVGVRSYGMLFNEVSWLLIDGTKWRGITIYGHNQYAMRFNSTTDHITMRNVEAYDNGTAEFEDGSWDPDSAGIRVAGNDHTFERMIVHDNGQDAFQSGAGPSPNFNDNNLDNLTIRQSWLYNGRSHPTVPESYNYCSHSDGLQINRGGSVSNITFEETIIGPGFTNGVLLGQTLTSNGAQATVDNVTFTNVLFTKAADNSIRGYRDTKPDGWVLDHVTDHCPNTSGHCLYIEGSNHTVTNSIIGGAAITFPDGLSTDSNNCRWNTSGYALGIEADPQFVNVNDDDPFSLDDYTLSAGSPCSGRGSSITSVTQLLSLSD